MWADLAQQLLKLVKYCNFLLLLLISIRYENEKKNNTNISLPFNFSVIWNGIRPLWRQYDRLFLGSLEKRKDAAHG